MSSNYGGYGNVLAGNNDDLYGDLFRAAIMWAMNRQGSGSGGTPNFYNIPLTPEQQRVEDERWRVYQSGGSPTQRQAQDIARQALSQSPTTAPGFQFMSPELRGQPFAGGVRLPTFNFSAPPPPAAPSTPRPTGNGSPVRGNPSGSPDGAIEHRRPYEYLPDGYTLPSGYDGPQGGDMFEPFRPPRGTVDVTSPDIDLNSPQANGPGGLYSRATQWFAGFQKEHPNWAQLGPRFLESALAAAFGLPGAVVGRVARWLLTRGSGDNPPSPPVGGGGNTGPVIPPGGAPGNVPPGTA